MAGWSNDFATVTRTYEPHRDLLTQVRNVAGGMTVSQYDYENDPLGRRTLRADSGSAFGVAITNDFGYNIRSEVESALMGTNQYGYAFDPIGNRERASLNAVTNLYAANALNQYTNVLAAVPPRDDTPNYDDDGNILRLRDWTLEWDGENRLVLASNATVTVRYAHDFMGRRVWRAADGVTNRFLYDGWALIRETISDQQSAITNHFVYGPDLSGSLQGAGTIGGLWLRTGPDGTAAFTYDGNGNVSELVDATGAIRAHYEYDAFGNVTAQSRDLAAANPFRFSSKRQDEATGLLYYGYRDLDTVWGRWVSRDPIGERGGENLYLGMLNAALIHWDPMGLWVFRFRGNWKPEDKKLIQDAHDAMKENMPKYLANVEEWIDAAAHIPRTCPVKIPILKEFVSLRITLEEMQRGLESSEEVTIRKKRLKKEVMGATRFDYWSDEFLGTIYFSTKLDMTDSDKVLENLFHELSHVAGLPDERKWKDGDPMSDNAQQVDNMATRPGKFSLLAYVSYHLLKLKPEQKRCCPNIDEWIPQ